MKLTKVTENKPARKSNKNPYADYTDEQLSAAHESAAMSAHPRAVKRLGKIQREISRRNKKLNEKTDVSELPLQSMKDLQKNITDGAKDTNQLWANALELVHKAYETSQVQRPEITMDAAWKQYEENIEFAVKALAKFRGADGEWRATSITTEAEDTRDVFTMETTVDNLPVVVKKKAVDIDELIKPFYDHNITGCDIQLKHRSQHHVVLYFCNEDGRTGDKVTIRKVT